MPRPFKPKEPSQSYGAITEMDPDLKGRVIAAVAPFIQSPASHSWVVHAMQTLKARVINASHTPAPAASSKWLRRLLEHVEVIMLAVDSDLSVRPSDGLRRSVVQLRKGLETANVEQVLALFGSQSDAPEGSAQPRRRAVIAHNQLVDDLRVLEQAIPCQSSRRRGKPPESPFVSSLSSRMAILARRLRGLWHEHQKGTHDTRLVEAVHEAVQDLDKVWVHEKGGRSRGRRVHSGVRRTEKEPVRDFVHAAIRAANCGIKKSQVESAIRAVASEKAKKA